MPRLKHLDLQGYKTFATKSQFVLGDGITAIVGPNGSGKSNIADSIRWVLGEQSFALLRGKKTEDMIFAGSELRPRASMAQAALTFDNADGWLPIDFAEVTITRRAYRDGENEYLLNGQRVRLRDVAELLARCGLAERTYTIIGQGLVDAALSLKAEERRALFEEAAGIGVYRDKREDALRRLEQTGHNLERVHDILSEIRPRLRALERQSARARDYAQVKADLDELLKVWYGFHWHEAQRTLTEAKASAETRTEELAGVQMEQETLDKEVLDVRAKISVLRGQINRQLTDTNRLRAERESLSRDLAVADERLRLFAAQRQEAMAELGPLDAELAEAERRVEAARADLNRLQSERDEAGREAETASQAIASGEAERRTLTAQEAAARGNAQALSTQIAERTFHREQIERRRAQIAAAKTEASDSLAAAEAKADELRLARDERTETLARIRGERHLASSQLLELTQKISVAESRLTGLSNAAAAARVEAERLAARQQALEQARADLGAFASGAKTLLAAAREGRLAGNARAIAALLRVPREYEIAVAAALGAQLDAIVVEDLNAADRALALLESEGGRAALVPLDKLAHVAPIVVPPDLEIVGVASALVECDTPLRPAVEILLARTIVVRAREAARRLLDAIPADARLVTLS
ncbi:MAG: AAA family ATPase, partial [Chloroflexi bacterium]|nr:AAA family ATPase [Chloroflexota bacterium]